MPFSIRPYRSSDLPALYHICLLTGDSGKDASQVYQDPDLLGHFYAAPYGVLEPQTCFVLEDSDGAASGGVCGYIIAAPDSHAFARRMNAEWLLPLQMRYPLPDPADRSKDAGMIRVLHGGYHPRSEADLYPAHLHIDLLERAQGQGQGRALMETLWARLRELGVPGVHLGVSAGNPSAIAFYQKLGYTLLEDYGSWQSYGLKL